MEILRRTLQVVARKLENFTGETVYGEETLEDALTKANDSDEKKVKIRMGMNLQRDRTTRRDLASCRSVEFLFHSRCSMRLDRIPRG